MAQSDRADLRDMKVELGLNEVQYRWLETKINTHYRPVTEIEAAIGGEENRINRSAKDSSEYWDDVVAGTRNEFRAELREQLHLSADKEKTT